jgi:uncharacterized membrane protein YpjA
MDKAIAQLQALSRTVMLKHDVLFWLWMGINLVGLVLGTVGWYGAQLQVTPAIWWIFVPDCPLAAGYAAAALWGLRQGKRWTMFNLFTAFACIKYGVWTCAVWLAYWSNGGPFVLLDVSTLMFVTHLGLIGQGVVLLLLTQRWTIRDVLPAIGFYAAADFVDYALGHHPTYPFQFMSRDFVQWHTVAMTWLLSGVLVYLGWRMEQRPTPETSAPEKEISAPAV